MVSTRAIIGDFDLAGHGSNTAQAEKALASALALTLRKAPYGTLTPEQEAIAKLAEMDEPRTRRAHRRVTNRLRRGSYLQRSEHTRRIHVPGDLHARRGGGTAPHVRECIRPSRPFGRTGRLARLFTSLRHLLSCHVRDSPRAPCEVSPCLRTYNGAPSRLIMKRCLRLRASQHVQVVVSASIARFLPQSPKQSKPAASLRSPTNHAMTSRLT